MTQNKNVLLQLKKSIFQLPRCKYIFKPVLRHFIIAFIIIICNQPFILY